MELNFSEAISLVTLILMIVIEWNILVKRWKSFQKVLSQFKFGFFAGAHAILLILFVLLALIALNAFILGGFLKLGSNTEFAVALIRLSKITFGVSFIVIAAGVISERAIDVKIKVFYLVYSLSDKNSLFRDSVFVVISLISGFAFIFLL